MKYLGPGLLCQNTKTFDIPQQIEGMALHRCCWWQGQRHKSERTSPVITLPVSGWHDLVVVYMLLLLFKIMRKQELLGNLPQRVDNMAWCRPPLHWVLQETSLSLHLVLHICKHILRTFSFSPKVCRQHCLILEKQMHNLCTCKNMGKNTRLTF